MKILVALKQVPDTETKVRIAPDGRSIDPSDVKWITSPYDEYALEEAIRLKEGAGAEVTALCVGEDKGKDILRNALALGADAAVLLKAPGTADPLAVARIIAAYADGKGFDLILCGKQGVGGDNSAVGPLVAELLGLPQANVVTKLEVTGAGFRAEREGDGATEVLEGTLPAVVTAERGLNEPRYASLKGIMAAKKKTIEELALEIPPAATETLSLTLPPARPEGRRLEGDASAQTAELVRLLRDDAKVI